MTHGSCSRPRKTGAGHQCLVQALSNPSVPQARQVFQRAIVKLSVTGLDRPAVLLALRVAV